MSPAWSARGDVVGPPQSVEKLTEEAELIFKGTVSARAPVKDDRLRTYPGFVATETQFRLVSVLKGDESGQMARFHHYEEDAKSQGRMSEPLHYHFDVGKTYLVFAKRAEQRGVYRQLWTQHGSATNQGAFLCSSNRPVPAKSVKEAIWSELADDLRSANAGDVAYAIHQLDQMSGVLDRFESTHDFDRAKVLEACHGLMSSADQSVATAAITLVGTHNPYLSDERTIFWLATVGAAEIPGIGKMDPKFKNVGGERYWKDLVALAGSKARTETRAQAIRALGLVREPTLRAPLADWLLDPKPAIRAAATILLADYPGPDTDKQLVAMMGDASAEVRASAVTAAGFAQRDTIVGALAHLLNDKVERVRSSASMSLLSFSPKTESVAKIFRTNLANEEYKPLFLIALARRDPGRYLDALAMAVERKQEPANYWGGQIPAFTAWEILFKYLQSLPIAQLRSGKLDRYLDAIEKVGDYSSSEPRDIYALYVRSGMMSRAKRYRSNAVKAVSYDLDYFFKQVDANPSLYTRQ
jgi:hypothetical protein